MIDSSVNSHSHKVIKSVNAVLNLFHFENLKLNDLFSSSKVASADADASVPGSSLMADAKNDAQPNADPPVMGIDPDIPGCKTYKPNFDSDVLVVNWTRDDGGDNCNDDDNDDDDEDDNDDTIKITMMMTVTKAIIQNFSYKSLMTFTYDIKCDTIIYIFIVINDLG